MDKHGPANIEVYGHSTGRFRVKSKFNRKGTTRSLGDLDWALAAFQEGNPHFAIIGQNTSSYYKLGDSVDFFRHKKTISRLMAFAAKNNQSVVRSSLTNLREMLSMNTKREGSFFRTSNFKMNNSKLTDELSLCEGGDDPDKR